jgi:hypothetical protein
MIDKTCVRKAFKPCGLRSFRARPALFQFRLSSFEETRIGSGVLSISNLLRRIEILRF